MLEHDFKVSRRRGLAKHRSKLTFVSPKKYTSGSMSSLSLTVPDFSSNVAWECGLQFQGRKRELLDIGVFFFRAVNVKRFHVLVLPRTAMKRIKL